MQIQLDFYDMFLMLIQSLRKILGAAEDRSLGIFCGVMNKGSS